MHATFISDLRLATWRMNFSGLIIALAAGGIIFDIGIPFNWVPIFVCKIPRLLLVLNSGFGVKS